MTSAITRVIPTLKDDVEICPGCETQIMWDISPYYETNNKISTLGACRCGGWHRTVNPFFPKAMPQFLYTPAGFPQGLEKKAKEGHKS